MSMFDVLSPVVDVMEHIPMRRKVKWLVISLSIGVLILCLALGI